MLSKLRNKALRPRRNIMGRSIRGRLDLFQVIALEHAGWSKDEVLDLVDRGWLLPMVGGATTAQNQAAENPTYFPRALVATSDQVIHQSDMVWWDPVNYTLKPLATVAQVAVSATGGYCGVAAGSNVPGVYPDPPAGTDVLPGVVVQRGGTVFLNGTAGDGAYNHFQPVTIGADAQTVTRGAETSADRVGLIVVPPPTSARGASGATPVPETEGSARVRVWLEPKFPTTALL